MTTRTTTTPAVASPRTPRAARPARSRLVALGLVVLGPGLLLGCSQGGDARPEAAKKAGGTASTMSTEVDDASTTVAPDRAPTDDGSTGGTSSPTGDTVPTGGQGSNGTTAPPPAPSAPAPTITSFTTPENIDCHNGNSQMFTASWAVNGAEKVTISIDGPGIYDTYPGTGSVSLPFECSTSHSFLLTAYGADGQTATRSVTLQPRNVQAPADSGDEEP